MGNKKHLSVLSIAAVAMLLSGCGGETSSSHSSSNISTGSLSSVGSVGSSSSSSIGSPSVGSSSVTSASSSIAESSFSSASEPVYELQIQTGEGTVSSRVRDINLDEITGSTKTDRIQLLVTKDGEEEFDEEIVSSYEGDDGVIVSIATSATVDHEMIVTFGGTGEATVTFSLKNHTETESVTVVYRVSENFLSSEIKRGDNVEANGVITLSGADQHTAVAKKADTKWKLNATLDVPQYGGTESVGIGGFLDGGDHAIWTAIRNTDGNADDVYEIYIRDFYAGWGSAIKDGAAEKAYEHVSFEGEENKNLIDVELIRNGVDYYFNIGGYHGRYTAQETRASYPGFFSQTKPMSITDYAVSYDREIIEEAIARDYGANAPLDAIQLQNADDSELARGESRTFSYISAPSYSDETVEWSVSEDYKETVAVSQNGTVTVSELAEAGEIEVFAKSASGAVQDSVKFKIVEESSAKESDVLRVKGGAILENENSVIFPEYKKDNDGVVQEEYYAENVPYCAELKQTVLGGNFSIEFDVENYKSNVEYPKLMISLGGKYNQFYIVYNRQGTINRIESHTQTVEHNDINNGHGWVNSNEFGAGFDTSASHHFKLESKDGFYYWYVDGSADPIVFHDGEDTSAIRKPIVPMYDFYQELPVRIGTKGVSCTVKNIDVQSGVFADLPSYYSHASSFALSDANEATMGFVNNAWSSQWQIKDNIYVDKSLNDLSGAWTLKFKAVFSDRMRDGKAILRIGEHEFQFVNSTGWGDKIEHSINGNFSPKNTNVLFDDTLTFDVTITKSADGHVVVSVPGKDGNAATYEVDGVTGTTSYFYGFNETAADVGKTVKITNLVLTKN